MAWNRYQFSPESYATIAAAELALLAGLNKISPEQARTALAGVYNGGGNSGNASYPVLIYNESPGAGQDLPHEWARVQYNFSGGFAATLKAVCDLLNGKAVGAVKLDSSQASLAKCMMYYPPMVPSPHLAVYYPKSSSQQQQQQPPNQQQPPTTTLRRGWGWGMNAHGELTDGTTATHNVPTEIPYLGKEGIKAIAAGSYHGLALLDDGRVWGWGYNNYGQVGDGSTTQHLAPMDVLHLRDLGVTAIATGPDHSMALLKDGTVMAWGRNDYSQLGLGSGSPAAQPIPVQVRDLKNAKAIAAGVYHSLALLEDGTVMAWGYNGQGQLGDGTTTSRTTPVAVAGLKNVKAITCGTQHNLALLEDGTVMAWGYNGYGQIGDGTNANHPIPVRVAGLEKVKAIAASRQGSDYDQAFSMALLEDGTVWAWGINNYSQLGDGTTASRSIPAEVHFLSGIKAIAAGGWHAMALKGDGTVWVWGYNGDGELGDGTTATRPIPGAVTGLSGIQAIAAGRAFCLALA